MKCESCKFWNPQNHSANILGKIIPPDHKDAQKAGECRANPPFPTKGDGTNWRMFPTTLAKDWCGDFEEKPAPPAVQPVRIEKTQFESAPTSFMQEIKKRVGRPRKDT